MRPTSIFLGFIGIATLPAASAQTGLNSLPEVEFAQLSQRDPNPLGERALKINPTQWKHGETEHYFCSQLCGDPDLGGGSGLPCTTAQSRAATLVWTHSVTPPSLATPSTLSSV